MVTGDPPPPPDRHASFVRHVEILTDLGGITSTAELPRETRTSIETPHTIAGSR